MENKFGDLLKPIVGVMVALALLVIVLIGMIIYLQTDPDLSAFRSTESNPEDRESEYVTEIDDKIENGVHVETGLVEGEGMQMVIANCTGCHSARLITQNRADKQGWLNMIRWMQETQNLWDLGDNEELILDYLSGNYAPDHRGRRAPLTNIEWYELKD